MITLFTAGPHFGLPDPSPFVSKAEVLLKMSGVPYRTAAADRRKAPKGKIPYIEDGGKLLGDSTFIRWHLEDRYGATFDEGLSAADRATAWAYEKLCEDHLYWTLVDSRWTDDANFDNGPRTFFKAAPAALRPFVTTMVRRIVKKKLAGHGMGLHSRAEIERLAIRDVDALSAFLADKAWLMGERPCGADAAVWSMITGVLCRRFETPIRASAESHPNLVAYRDRGLKTWFPDFVAGGI